MKYFAENPDKKGVKAVLPHRRFISKICPKGTRRESNSSLLQTILCVTEKNRHYFI